MACIANNTINEAYEAPGIQIAHGPQQGSSTDVLFFNSLYRASLAGLISFHLSSHNNACCAAVVEAALLLTLTADGS